MEKKVLGKGLSALISRNAAEKSGFSEMSTLENVHSGSVQHIKTMSILENRFQPRKNYDDARLDELKASIKEKGILQPILVRKNQDGFEVVAGERRLRAAKAIGLDEVPVIIKNVTDRESLVLALVENIQREELNAIEEALGFKRLIEDFQFTQDSVAEAVGKDRTTITNVLRLLKLPEDIQKHVADGKISMGHARAIINVEDKMLQSKLAQAVIEKGISVRQMEDLVKKSREQTQTKIIGKPKNRDVEILEDELQKILGTKVLVEDKKGKGKVVIEYYSLDDLDRILGVLRK